MSKTNLTEVQQLKRRLGMVQSVLGKLPKHYVTVRGIAYRCPLCGSNRFLLHDTIKGKHVCCYCGRGYTPDEINKAMGEI